MSAVAETLDRLAARAGEEGEPLVLRPEGPSGEPSLGALTAVGPRTAGDPDRYSFVVESIREGYLSHYGTSRLLDQPDPDLSLLAGDLFYAIGLNELAGLDDLESTGILSDLIRVAADLRATGHPERSAELWLVQVIALSCGKPEDYDARLEAVATGDQAVLDELFAWAKTTADRLGMGREFGVACKAIHLRPSNL
ncbi:MAG: hypothetical protein M3Y45_06480 [Actinomycetota bacterium]|nr:hypothetical protein [Actinomycetota bacterium]